MTDNNKQLALACKSFILNKAEHETDPELRDELLAQAKAFCWHEWIEIRSAHAKQCSICGKVFRADWVDKIAEDEYLSRKYPRFTIAPVEGYISITDTLKEFQLLDSFVFQVKCIVIDTVFDIVFNQNQISMEVHEFQDIVHIVIAEILTTPELLATAVTSFLKGRE